MSLRYVCCKVHETSSECQLTVIIISDVNFAQKFSSPSLHKSPKNVKNNNTLALWLDQDETLVSEINN